MESDREPRMPSDVSPDVGAFDRFSTAVGRFASRPWFFLGCVLLVVIWAPTVAVFTIDTWQLIINTATTIITFLLVALLQNTQSRSDAALQQKLNAIASGLSDLMAHFADDNPELERDRHELRQAVGLEERE